MSDPLSFLDVATLHAVDEQLNDLLSLALLLIELATSLTQTGTYFAEDSRHRRQASTRPFLQGT